MADDRIDWPKYLLIFGGVAFALNAPQAAPQLVSAGGLTAEQWASWIGPLLLAVPKFVDLWRNNRKAAVSFAGAIAALEVIKRYSVANNLDVGESVDEIATAVVATLGSDEASPKGA
jgi:hypothetical protein